MINKLRNCKKYINCILYRKVS